MNRYSFGSLVILLLVQGCSAFSPPKSKPVIEDRISQHRRPTVGVLATTPERRVFLVKMPGSKFCAEPSADAAENISSALSAMVKGSVTGKVTDAQLGLGQTLATSVKQLFVRTQGIQLYRDATFMLCTAYLNDAINKEQLIAMQEKLLETVVPLILAEIPTLQARRFDAPPPPTEQKEGNSSPTAIENREPSGGGKLPER